VSLEARGRSTIAGDFNESPAIGSGDLYLKDPLDHESGLDDTLKAGRKSRTW